VGANFRASRRARSDKEFVAKLQIVLEEVDECCYWLEIIQELKWADVDDLLKEANELTAIIVSILKKMNDKLKNKK
jgi:four helix bundle protein